MRKQVYIWLILFVLFSVESRGEVFLTLDSCMQLARMNSPSLRKSQLDIKRAEEVKAQAFTKYFPQVQGTAFGYHALHPLVDIGIEDISNAGVRDLLTTLYGNYGAALGLDNMLNLFQYGYMVGVSAVQPLFAGGKIIAGNRLAKIGVEAAQLQSQIAERDQLEQVEESYWLVYSLMQKQHIVDDALMLLDTLYSAVDASVKAGLALPSDLTRVQLHRDEILRRQLQINSGLRLARRALALSVGLPDGDSVMVAEQTAETEVVLPADTIAQTAEQQLLSLQLRAAELERRMALADALPQLAVGANYSYSHWQSNIFRNGLGSKTGNGALFVTLNVPLTGWWETAHKLKEKQYAVDQARIDEEYIGAQLNLRTRQTYDQMAEAAALLNIQQRAAAHAEEAWKQADANYQAGRITIAELLQSQTEYTQARSDLADAQIAYRIAARRYKDLINSK